MSYTALYRKWRPATFDDVRGQDAIVKTLQNQIVSGRVGHAYLFCGTRGTGKTSIAKIMAKAVNCEHPINGNPCGECDNCKAIAAGNSINVIEIDAASNNGVDNVREIRDNVAYSPTNAKFKVYIIDEVHMLSTGAFNALLKTLEEPPSYVIFILATTEAHKIPVTILSRCQRYDFKRIPTETLAGRLREITKAEGIEAEDKAINYIAKSADGGMRDAISLLDQCTAYFYGQTITYEKALEVLGAVDTQVFSIFLRDIAAGSIVDAMHLLDKISSLGRDYSQFVVDFIWYMRNILLVKTTRDPSEVVDVTADNLKAMVKEAECIEADQLLRYIRIFSELIGEMRYAQQKRILIEIAVIKLCKPSMETDYESLLERVRVLEKQLENGIAYSQDDAVSDEEKARRKREKLIEEENLKDQKEKALNLPKATKDDLSLIYSKWTDIIRDMPDIYKSCLRESIPKVRPDDGRLFIQVKDRTIGDLCTEEYFDESIKAAFANRIGKIVEYQIITPSEEAATGKPYPEISIFGMEVEVDDSDFTDEV